MSSTVQLAKTVLERQTATYSFVLVDENGNGIDGAQLTTLTLTYYDVATGTIINGRDEQDAHNLNNVTITTAIGPPLVATVTWAMQPEDTVRLGSRREVEPHGVVFQWTWGGGTKHNAHKVQFGIEALIYVLASLE